MMTYSHLFTPTHTYASAPAPSHTHSTRSSGGAATTVTDPSGPNAHLNARPRTYLHVLPFSPEAECVKAGGGGGGSERGEQAEVLASGEVHRVTVLGDVQSVHWSPDGRKLLIFSSPLQRYAVTKARRLFLPGGLRPRRRKERQAEKSLAEPAVLAMSVLQVPAREAGDGEVEGARRPARDQGAREGLVSEIIQWIKPSATMKAFVMASRQGQPHLASPVRARGSLWSPSSDAVCWAGCRASRLPDTGEVRIDPQEGVWLQRVGGGGPAESPRQEMEVSGAGQVGDGAGNSAEVAGGGGGGGGGDGGGRGGEGARLIQGRGDFALWSHS